MVAFGGRRLDPQAADDPARRRPRAAPVGGDRPALRPAQPLRSAADDRRPVTAPARHRRRRGHRRRRRGGRRRARGAPRSSAAARSRSSTGPDRRPTPTRPSAPRPSSPAASCLHVLPAGAQFDLTDAHPDPAGDGRGSTRRRPRSPRPASDLRQMARDIAADDVSPQRSGGGVRGPLTQEDSPTTPTPGRSQLMTERPTPDLTILETRVYRGANIWSYEKAIHLVVDLGSLEDFPTDTLPGFTDHLLELLPGLREHSCSRGRRGGFVERLNEGTWLGHVAEHVGAGPAAGGRPRHPPRQDPPGQGRARPLQRHLRLRRRAGRRSPRPSSPSGWSTTWSRPTPTSTSRPSSSRSSCAPSARRSARPRRRSSTRRSPATSRGSGSTSTRSSSSARASTRSGSGPR